MNNFKYEGIYLRTDWDNTKQTDMAVNVLAERGHPPAKVIKAIIDAMHGKDICILDEVQNALDEVGSAYDDELLFDQVWYYFTQKENTAYFSVIEFLCALAKALFKGSDGFPVHKELSSKIMDDVRRSISWNDIIGN